MGAADRARRPSPHKGQLELPPAAGEPCHGPRLPNPTTSNTTTLHKASPGKGGGGGGERLGHCSTSALLASRDKRSDFMTRRSQPRTVGRSSECRPVKFGPNWPNLANVGRPCQNSLLAEFAQHWSALGNVGPSAPNVGRCRPSLTQMCKASPESAHIFPQLVNVVNLATKAASQRRPGMPDVPDPRYGIPSNSDGPGDWA